MNTISAVIITYNEESNIENCIDSVKAVADEIIVIDSGSWDRTVEICEAKKTLLYKKKFVSFSDQKNYGNRLAHSDYILSLDADEYLSPELTRSILAIKQNMDYGGYTMNRLSSYAGQYIRTCGWYPDRKLRIWKKNSGFWIGQGIHEKIELNNDKSTCHIKGNILHRAYNNVYQFLEKIQRYSEIYAQDQRFRISSSGFKVFYKTAFTFIKSYFFQRGMCDGYNGLIISICNANHTFYKYAKLREANKKLKISLIISTYNREDALEAILLSVFNQSEWPYEVIIADDGSGELTKKLVRRYSKKISIPVMHCWHEDRGFRLSAIRNKAMAMATGEYIIMIDGDIVMHSHFIEGHRKNARKNQVIQGSRVLLGEKTTKKWLASKKFRFSLFNEGGKNHINAIYSPLLSKIISLNNKNVTRVRGANMSFWKEDLVRINGFNEDFVGWGREDSEFIARMYNAGVGFKRLKFMGFGYHLYHEKWSRASLQENDSILEKTILKKLSWCEKGIDQYISV